MRRLTPALLAVTAAALFSLWAYSRLPAIVPTHFGAQGEPNGWSSRLVAVLIGPAAGLLVALIFRILPAIDPRGANYPRFAPIYWGVANVVVIFIAFVHILVLGKGLGWSVRIDQAMPIAIGTLIAFLGAILPGIRPNWFLGIRTPWTLSSDSVWEKTHRVGGVLFLVAGVAILLTALFASRWMPYTTLLAIGIAALGSVVYSWYLWREEQRAMTAGTGRD